MQNKVAKKFLEQVVKKDANKQYFCFVFSDFLGFCIGKDERRVYGNSFTKINLKPKFSFLHSFFCKNS